MDILYLEEHRSCFNYSCKEESAISFQTIYKGAKWNMVPKENMLIFVTEGELLLSYNKGPNMSISRNKILLILANSECRSIAKKTTKYVLVKIPANIQFCDRYSLEKLQNEIEGDHSEFCFLDMNVVVYNYLNTLQSYIKGGLMCKIFFDIKIKELFFILRGYYPKKILFNFFYPMLSSDVSFSQFIQKNYNKVKTIKELAELSNYSMSGFVKKFKKVFGTSAYQWMRDQKAVLIYHEINDRTKTLKEISSEYGFSSPAHFNDFCKSHFNDTPGNIRKNKESQVEVVAN